MRSLAPAAPAPAGGAPRFGTLARGAAGAGVGAGVGVGCAGYGAGSRVGARVGTRPPCAFVDRRGCSGASSAPSPRSSPPFAAPAPGGAGSASPLPRLPAPPSCASSLRVSPRRSVAFPPAPRLFLCGVRIPDEKRIECSLTYIYGIGRRTASAILEETGVENKRTRELTEAEVAALKAEIEAYETGETLQKYERDCIQRLKDIRCYRGARHAMGLPVRGQNTRTNAKTAKKRRPKIAAAEATKRTEAARAKRKGAR